MNNMSLIFVCTSNVCRSPVAAALANKWLQDNGRSGEFTIISRSLTTDYEPEHSPASEHSLNIIKNDFGIDISDHRSKLLTEDDVRNAHIIVGITESHCGYITRTYSHLGASKKCVSMPRDVPDPWHADYKTYHRCVHFMNDLMPELFGLIDSTIDKTEL